MWLEAPMASLSIDRESGSRALRIRVGRAVLDGDLEIPAEASSVVLFAHGTGSSRTSPRNRLVAAALRRAGLGTLLFDLLTGEEEAIDLRTGELRFDIGLLAARLTGSTRWLRDQEEFRELRVGYFGASTGAAAALVAGAEPGAEIGAIVSRGGRPDLAGGALERVTAPTLLIVGGRDGPVIRWNEEALARLRCEKQMRVIPGATHLFEQPGALEEVALLSAAWFVRHLGRAAAGPPGKGR
jgi:putative phosphoribosyl transferase